MENIQFFGGFKSGVSKFRFKTDIHTLQANLKFHKPKNCHFWFTLKGPLSESDLKLKTKSRLRILADEIEIFLDFKSIRGRIIVEVQRKLL